MWAVSGRQPSPLPLRPCPGPRGHHSNPSKVSLVLEELVDMFQGGTIRRDETFLYSYAATFVFTTNVDSWDVLNILSCTMPSLGAQVAVTAVHQQLVFVKQVLNQAARLSELFTSRVITSR